MEDLDTAALSRDLMRALRGHRSREAFARRLGASANAVYAWETGRRVPPADLFFLAAQRTGIDVLASLRRFLGPDTPAVLSAAEDARLCSQILGVLRGRERTSELARRAGVERTALSRWLSGTAIPRLPDFLALVEACNARTVDFVAVFVAPDELPSLGPSWTRIRATRRLIGEAPWATSVLVALDLSQVQQASAHPPGFLGAQVGIDAEAERRCLDLLVEAGLVAREGERWVALPRPPVGLQAPSAKRAARAWAAREAADRIEADEDGVFGFIAFAAAEADIERLQQLHRDYADAVKAIVLNPSGCEAVYVVNAHLFPLARRRGGNPRREMPGPSRS